MYEKPTKVTRDTVTCINYAISPVRLDPDMCITPKKKTLYSTSPHLVRRSPRLVAKSIDAVSRCSGIGKRLFVNSVDNVDNHEDVVLSIESQQDEMEYENIQLTNDQEVACHPIDDPRSPISDTEEMGIEVYCEFVNNYFGGTNFSDFLHPQKYKKANEKQSEQSGAKGKSIVVYDGEGLYPSLNQDGDSSSSDFESEGVTEEQRHES
ncbi:hypothetical protein MKX01_022396 [Papaver californicum]|nr:hypothetical protein MKX01_022396 [Papaver californicum]